MDCLVIDVYDTEKVGGLGDSNVHFHFPQRLHHTRSKSHQVLRNPGTRSGHSVVLGFCFSASSPVDEKPPTVDLSRARSSGRGDATRKLTHYLAAVMS